MASLVPDKVAKQSTQEFCLEQGLPFVAVLRDAPRVPGHRVRVDVGATTPAARVCPLLHTHTCVFRALGPCGCCVRVRCSARAAALRVEEDGPEMG